MRAKQRDIEDKRRSEVEKERAWKDVVRLQVAEYISKRKDVEKEIEATQSTEMCAQRERGKLANVGVARFLIRDREAAELQKQKADELLHQELERQNVLQKLRNTVRIEGTRNADRATGKTEVWKSREKANKEGINAKCTSREAPVMKLGAHRLATPSWRQNL
eukprot:TRINITY_DN9661_c0_g2_i1.p1 TRINITY_DN9661_c0_g2~~TRINITY_DN9661_c0_g2_i1.p1  ORF type:complete len:163 (+),score=36.69 TRINITY_DN9661_c0_g2_i1:442-930(+)